jgi:hypothetical protein
VKCSGVDFGQPSDLVGVMNGEMRLWFVGCCPWTSGAAARAQKDYKSRAVRGEVEGGHGEDGHKLPRGRSVAQQSTILGLAKTRGSSWITVQGAH